MINFIKSIFGGSAEKTAPESHALPKEGESYLAHAVAVENPDELEKFVEFIVRGLVDKVDEVSVKTEAAENENQGRLLRIYCAKEDVGKVVGKKGKTIIALRSLINGAAGRIQRRIQLEVAD